jgi:hypothetical protein
MNYPNNISENNMSWESFFKDLEEFKEKYGHFKVASNRNYRKLAEWVALQRKKKHQLTEKQVSRLAKLGFDFNSSETYFENKCKEYTQFHQKYGHPYIPNKGSYKLLSLWILRTRSLYKKGKLSIDKIKRLNEIKFQWDWKNAQWLFYYNQLVLFDKEYGHSRVPANKTKKEQNLYSWVNSLRKNKSKLTEEQLELLSLIHFDFTPNNEAHFALMCMQYQLFRLAFPGESFPRTGEFGPVGVWANRIKKDRNKLSEDELEIIESIGFVWSELEKDWNQNMAMLRDFKKDHGHVMVPDKWAANKKLAHFVAGLRPRKARLSRRVIKELDSLGFAWDVNEHKWMIRYNDLVEFYEENGHSRVPSTDEQYKQLYSWITHMREFPDKLSRKRKKLLKKVNFILYTNYKKAA